VRERLGEEFVVPLPDVGPVASTCTDGGQRACPRLGVALAMAQLAVYRRSNECGYRDSASARLIAQLRRLFFCELDLHPDHAIMIEK
jgi:hypothetical protein